MSFVVEFTETAYADLRTILDFIAHDDPRRASIFVEQLEERTRRQLELFPNSGMKIGDYRFVVFGEYVVVYSVDEILERVLVVLVAQRHREWRKAFE